MIDIKRRNHVNKIICVQIISFPVLETLELSFVNVREIWYSQLADSTCFRNLVTLIVHHCESLKNLLSFSVAVNLVQLKRLEIGQCSMMEEIISTNGMTNKIIFPRMNSLKLQNLGITKFCSATFVEFPLLTELSITDCQKLETFVSSSDENHGSIMISLFNENVRLFIFILSSFFTH